MMKGIVERQLRSWMERASVQVQPAMGERCISWGVACVWVEVEEHGSALGLALPEREGNSRCFAVL